MTVVIKNPNTEPGTVSEKLLRFKCCFIRDDEGYGKKTYLSIDGEGWDTYLDLVMSSYLFSVPLNRLFFINYVTFRPAVYFRTNRFNVISVVTCI